MLLEKGPGGVQCSVEAAQRRAAIAGDVAGGMQAGTAIARMLQHGQAGKCLHPGEEGAAVVEPVFVFE